MKLTILGDIHGRLIWHDIIEKEKDSDFFVFLGDYVSTHDKISSEQQLANLEDILNFKEENPYKVILLRGNHDTQHCGYYWAQCSGYFPAVAKDFPKDRFEELTQWSYIFDNIIFSHAGVSQRWLDDNHVNINEVSIMPINEAFGFTPEHRSDYCGDSVTQPPTWIRPWVLDECWPDGDWIQVVGHTGYGRVFSPTDMKKDHVLWLCDALAENQYLTIVNGKFEVQELTK